MRKINEVDKKKIEVISHEMLEMCAKNGLTIAETLSLAHIFLRLVREKIEEMKQRISFTVDIDQGQSGSGGLRRSE